MLTPSDFRQDGDWTVDNLRITREDVAMADLVIVIDPAPRSPEDPVILRVLKERHPSGDYKIITRPPNLAYE
jgi:hypothetical protein